MHSAPALNKRNSICLKLLRRIQNTDTKDIFTCGPCCPQALPLEPLGRPCWQQCFLVPSTPGWSLWCHSLTPRLLDQEINIHVFRHVSQSMRRRVLYFHLFSQFKDCCRHLCLCLRSGASSLSTRWASVKCCRSEEQSHLRPSWQPCLELQLWWWCT